MPRQGDVHVLPGQRGWRVKVEGNLRPSSTHKTQSEAAKAAREIARRNRSELIHGRDGRVRDRSTYGRDPDQIKG
jgi:hypothetical protein